MGTGWDLDGISTDRQSHPAQCQLDAKGWKAEGGQRGIGVWRRLVAQGGGEREEACGDLHSPRVEEASKEQVKHMLSALSTDTADVERASHRPVIVQRMRAQG